MIGPRLKSHSPLQRRGVALMLVMVAVLITGGMAVAYFGSRDNSVAISENIQTATVARTSAESGLNLAIAILETGVDWRTQHIDGVILDEFQFGVSMLSITVVDAETQSPPTSSTNKVEITIRSSVENISQIIQATATIIEDENEFDVDFSEFAVFAQSNIQIRDFSSINHWAASPLSMQSAEILVGTLSTTPMSIEMYSGKQSESLIAHTPDRASSMVVTVGIDRKTFSDTPHLANPPTPDGNRKSLEIQTREITHSQSWRQNWSTQFISGRHQRQDNSNEQFVVSEGVYELDNLKLTGGQTMLIEGRVSIVVHEGMTLENAAIVLGENASLELFVDGDVSLHSGYLGNEDRDISSWMDPSRFQLYGTNHSSWEFDGRTTVKAEMYAPESHISLSGNTTVCGRIAGDDVTMRGASRLLYDPTLDHGGYADQESALYDDEGDLVSGLRSLAQLDQVLIDAIHSAAIEEVGGLDDDGLFRNRQWMSVDWRMEPTERPHEVIYVLIMYGIDAREWETRAIAHRHHRTTQMSQMQYNQTTFAKVLD